MDSHNIDAEKNKTDEKDYVIAHWVSVVRVYDIEPYLDRTLAP